MSIDTNNPEHLFNPNNVGESIRQPLPIHGEWLSGLISGDIESTEKGRGSDRDGARPYQDGDDIRKIDWKASMRTPDDSLVVRDHYAEVTPNLYLVTDVFHSRYSVNPGICSEQLLGASMIASLLASADSEGIPTALVASTDRSLYVQPLANMGRKHLLNTGYDMASMLDPDQPASKERTSRAGRAGRFEEAEATSLASTLRRLGKIARESVIVVVSDFREDLEPSKEDNGWVQQLKRLKRAGNIILATELTNITDFELPEKDVTLKSGDTRTYISDAEKDKLSQRRRELYAVVTKAQQAEIDETIAKLTIGHIKLSTIPAEEPGDWMRQAKHQIRRISKRN